MPVPDPHAGQAFICLISFFLFLSIAVGGGCLIAYTLLAYPPGSLPYVGIFFVCLPWLFWLLTFLYRIISRAFGFRMVIGSGGGGAGGRNVITPNSRRDHVMTDDIEPAGGNTESSSVATPRGAQFGEAVMVGEQNGENEGDRSKKRMSTSSNSSVASHESEKPLTISMAG